MTETNLPIQQADWKTEKHVPAIECADKVSADELFEVRLTLGKEIAHPNTTEHHIRWIALYFLPQGAKQPYQVAQVEFAAHGESVAGANQGPVYTAHTATVFLKVKQPGTLFALALCNIHGLWENSKAIALT